MAIGLQSGYIPVPKRAARLNGKPSPNATRLRYHDGLTPFDASPYFGAPAGTFNVQVTPQQAQFLASPPPGTPLAALQQYIFLAGGGSGIAINRSYPAAFALIAPGGSLQQFPTSCNSGNTTCTGLPTGFLGLASQAGNFPVFEGTSVYSLRLDHNINANNQLMITEP